MRTGRRAVVIVASLVWANVLLALIVMVGFSIGPLFAGVISLLLIGFYGWVFFAFLHYRHGRQEEVLHLLATAVESDAPLASALWSYLEDRPQGPLREFWVATLLLFVMPAYYWLWHWRHSFDRKLESVTWQLEHGVSLHEALLAHPGVASRDTLLAVAIGQSTGQMARCLRHAACRGKGDIFLELVPWLLYPLGVLAVVFSVTTFWMVNVLPRMRAIYRDFGETFPLVSRQFIEFWDAIESRGLFVVLGLNLLALLVLILVFSPTACWYFPLVRRFYRMHVQSRLLCMLAIILETREPVPAGLHLLAESGYFTGAARKRLHECQRLVEQGEPLGLSLHRRGLLPAAMLPLVQSAERARNLPWVFTELSESLRSRLMRTLRRISTLVSPITVVLLGGLVGFIVIGIFLPLVHLMESLVE